MKANQKFQRGGDEAVSPVIAVILMVAITVVLAATVYVWVSGFGGGNGSPAKTMALSSNGALSGGTTKTYTVTAATSGMKWSDVTLTLDGASLTYTGPVAGTDQFCVATTSSTCIVTASWDAANTLISAGQQLTVRDTSLSGQTLRILDSQANSVILTLVVG